MAGTWETLRSGPRDAPHGALLLPGGGCAAASYADLMADPALAGVRLVAVTMPGQAGAPAPSDYSVGSYAREAAALAADEGCDVVVGFSMGATVALEMTVSGLHAGPVVLVGISLSPADEPGFFRAVVRSSTTLGGVPVWLLMRATSLAARTAKVSETRRRQLVEELRRNDPRAVGRSMVAYLAYLEREDPTGRLCGADVPTWVVHAERGDGGLTAEERRVLDACPQVRLVTLPGTAFFLPDERPHEVARIVAEAVAAAGQ